MHQLERVWWEELADRYETWAENPPRDHFPYVQECHTCDSLMDSEFGWNEAIHGHPVYYIRLLWCWQYKDSEFPAGHTWDSDRPDRRFEFCWWMAETVRDYLEKDRGPWEVNDD